jgi:deoxycytidylate deaminase
MDVIIRSSEQELRGATLVLARVGYNGKNKTLIAKPCSHCAKYIIHSGIRRVFYTGYNDTIMAWDVKSNVHRAYIT